MRTLAAALLAMLAACGQSTAPAPTGPQADPGDSAEIIERLPLIDACLALSPDTRTITINPNSTLSVRLSGEHGSFDCVVPNDARDPANATILPALEEPPADAILFVRGPGENPGGECYVAPEVRHDGEVIGWLLDPEGC
jgi:hypothetical protein